MRRIGGAVAVVAALALSVPGVAWGQTASGVVVEVVQSGPVDPLSARYVERSIDRAESLDAAAVLLRIDTPGGLDSSMRRIVRAVLGSRIPVICWVGPPGARAASAGAFILVGCPVAAMAPGTNVGAAHPVGITGDVLAEKVTNDAAAYIRSLAQRWGRNADWAEDAVRDAVSVSASEALALKVIDIVAPDARALFAAAQGRTVRTEAGDVVLFEDGVPSEIVGTSMTAGESILHSLVDPNLAFLFFVFGIAGVVFEVLNPGLSVPGVLGVLMLVSAFIILGMLPVNVGGLLLIAAAVGFFIVDLHVPGHGLPTVAGGVSLVLGGLFLFNASVPNARVSRPLVVAVAIASASMFFFVIRAVLTARKAPPTAGAASIVGMQGTVVRDIDPTGVVSTRGEEWSAVSSQGPIAAGTAVRVVEARGLTVLVEPVARDEAGQSARRPGTEVS